MAEYTVTLTNGAELTRLLQGAGSPEGVVTAGPGVLYADTTNGQLYVKNTGTGNTGWTLLNSAGLVSTVAVAAATHTLGAGEIRLRVTYTATGAVTVSLATSETNDGRWLVVKDAGGNAGTNNITIVTEGAETIDGNASAIISGDYDSLTLFSDGSNWFIE